MAQAARHISNFPTATSSKTLILAYFAKILTSDRWTPISSIKLASEVGISQSCANRTIQRLAEEGRILRQYGFGRKDACAYRLPPPSEPSPDPVQLPEPVRPPDSLGQTIRSMREMERIMADLPPTSPSFDLLLKARGELLRLTAALRSGSVGEAIERLGVLFEMVNPDLEDEVSISGQLVLATIRDMTEMAA